MRGTRLRALMGRLADEGLDASGLARLARRAAEADEALARRAAEVEARLGDGPIDANALAAEPIAIVERVLARRIAAVGGRDEGRIGLEKIEALAAQPARRRRRRAGARRQCRRRAGAADREREPRLHARAGAARAIGRRRSAGRAPPRLGESLPARWGGKRGAAGSSLVSASGTAAGALAPDT